MRKIIISLALVGLSSLVIVNATKAYFSSQAVNSNNQITTGVLTVSLAEHGIHTLPLNVSDLAPGGSITHCVRISNTGTLPFDGSFTLNKVSESSPYSLYDVLKIKTYLWSGGGAPDGNACKASSTADWTDLADYYLTEWLAPVNFGSLPSGNDKYLKITFYLEDDLHMQGDEDVDDNLYQGSWVEYDLQVDALQLI